MAVVRCDTLSSVSLHLCGDSKHSWHLTHDANSWKRGAFVPNVCFYLDGMFDLNSKWQGGIATTIATYIVENTFHIHFKQWIIIVKLYLLSSET